MPSEAAAAGPARAVHATAVAIDGLALLLRGPSRAGKSALALDLIARSRPCLPILLVGDDRVLLQARGGTLWAQPHPRLAGLIERRGHGIVACCPALAAAPVAGIVDLGDAGGLRDDLGQNFPVLALVKDDIGTRPCRVLRWFAATVAQQRARILSQPPPRPAKD